MGKKLSRAFWGLLLTACLTGRADADLIIDVIGSPGSSTTTWTFSGTATATSNATFQGNSNGNPQNDGLWLAGDFTTLNNTWFTGVSGVTVDVGGTSYAADDLYLDTRGNKNADDAFAISLGSNNVALTNNTVISWSGSTVMNIPFDNLIAGSYTSTTFGGASLQLNIQAVPEPSCALLFGTVGVVLLKRRRFI